MTTLITLLTALAPLLGLYLAYRTFKSIKKAIGLKVFFLILFAVYFVGYLVEVRQVMTWGAVAFIVIVGLLLLVMLKALKDKGEEDDD